MRVSPLFHLLFLSPILIALPALRGQNAQDGIMMGRDAYCTGVFYSYDTWDHYWEGSNFRANGNIGAVTTRTISYMGDYGLTSHINLLVDLPHVATSSSSGTLHGQHGWQDASFAVKAKVIDLPIFHAGALRTIATVSFATPMSPYSPDDMPMSIGTQSNRWTGRVLENYLGKNGLYAYGSIDYNLRSNVQLSRPQYYTNGQLYLSSQVAMPNVFDWAASAGYRRHDTTLVFNYSSQQTRGGGDIRAQDMPFVSNRMNASRVGGTVTLPMPRTHGLEYWATYSYVLDGRNLGQANTATVGMTYIFNFSHKKGVM